MLINSLAAPIIAQTVTPANFAGPPMLIVGQLLSATTDPRWVAALSLAAAKTSPLVGLALGEDTGTLDAGLAAMSHLFVPSRSGAYAWTDGTSVDTPKFLGPILCSPDEPGGDAFCRASAWTIASFYARHANYNRYGVGLLACGPGDQNGLTTPPVYPLDRSALTDDVNTLANVWVRGGPVERSSLETLVALEATRPGISRRVHPALVPYILLEAP